MNPTLTVDRAVPVIPRAALVTIGVLSFLVCALWLFPRAWYTRSDTDLGRVWLGEQTNVTGWVFQELPVGASAESLLVADRLFNGEFRRDGGRDLVRVFSAKRYSEKANEIGLFVHTPDRCWTQAGWQIEAVSPDHAETTVHGIEMVFERRIFMSPGQRELVYFGGFVGGRPLPYRLDHNRSVGMKYAVSQSAQKSGGRGGAIRAADRHFWQRVWDSFCSRSQLLGPKQFIRLSTPVLGGDQASADKLLQEFLEAWLQPVNYEAEIAAWEFRKT